MATTSIAEPPSKDQVQAAAQRLTQAAQSRITCAPVRDLIGKDHSAAYAVQESLNQARKDAGNRVVGRKIGPTAAAVQAKMGIDHPDFGVLFDDMECAEGDEVPYDRLLQPRIEVEVALFIGADLDDGPLDEAQIRRAVESAAVAFEIVDSRITDWDITFADTVADNGSSGMFMVSGRRLTLDEFDPLKATMTLTRGDEVVGAGQADAGPWDPLTALAWLAAAARDADAPLRAGDIVLSGSLAPMFAVQAGEVYTGTVPMLGELTARFGQPKTDQVQ